MEFIAILIAAGATGTLLLATTYLLVQNSKLKSDVRVLAVVSQQHNAALHRLQKQDPQPHYVAQAFEGYTKVTWNDGTENWVWTGYQDY